jgi:hypothetical protein
MKKRRGGYSVFCRFLKRGAREREDKPTRKEKAAFGVLLVAGIAA